MTSQSPNVSSTETNAILSSKTSIHSTPIFFIGYPTDEGNFQGLAKNNPKNYSLQPVDSESLQFALQLLVEQQIRNAEIESNIAFAAEKYLLIKKKEILVKVSIDDIFYIQSEDKYCYIHTTDTRFLVQKSLKSFAETLPQNFVNLHRKHVINLNQIQSISPSDYTLTLKNNATLPVSQRHRKLLLNLFTIIK